MKRLSALVVAVAMCLSLGMQGFAYDGVMDVDFEKFANEVNKTFLQNEDELVVLSHEDVDITDMFLGKASQYYVAQDWEGFYEFCVDNVGTLKRVEDIVQNGVRGMDATQLHRETIDKYCRWNGTVTPSEYYPGISAKNNNGYITMSVACSFTYNTDTGKVTSVSKPYKTGLTQSGFRTELYEVQIINESYSHGSLSNTSCNVTYYFTPSAWFYVGGDSPQALLSYYSESATMTLRAK